MARILLVDDEANIRMMVRLALQQNKHTLEMAADGPEGLEKFGDGGWGLVLLDQRMPGMAGMDVLREMRRRDPKAQIILITAFGTVDLVMDAQKAGATDFLRKPFTIETLRGAVQAALAAPPPPAREETPYFPEPAEPPVRAPLTFSAMTLNGFRIEFQPLTGLKTGEDTLYTFTVISPARESHPCTVLLPNYLKELVKAHANREAFPGGDRFWQALSEETLTDYVWQQAAVPPQGVLRVADLTAGLRHWIDLVLMGVE